MIAGSVVFCYGSGVDPHTNNRPFPITRWSLVAKAGEKDSAKKKEALEALCSIYWPPIYAFIRSKGAPPAEAEDLTQGFFASFLARDDFARASREAGKLRTFMLAAVKDYMANDWRGRNCLKRGGGVDVVSIDLRYEDSREKIIEPVDHDTPETIFDRQWALTLLQNVFQALERKYEAKGRREVFDALHHVISTGGGGKTYSEIADRLGMTEGAVKVAAHRLRERYAKLLRETVADTVAADVDVSVELQELMAAFG